MITPYCECVCVYGSSAHQQEEPITCTRMQEDAASGRICPQGPWSCDLLGPGIKPMTLVLLKTPEITSTARARCYIISSILPLINLTFLISFCTCLEPRASKSDAILCPM